MMTIRSRPQLCCVFCCLAILGIVVLTSGLWAQGPQKKLPAPPEFAVANTVLKSLDDVGSKLIDILADAKRPKAIRLEAAEWLGKLRYAPAIPKLIQYVDLVDTAQFTSDGPEYPCRDALQMMGDAAVPSLVDAFLKTDSQRLELCLFTGIARKSQPAARTYAKGLATQNPAPEIQERVRILLDDIKPDVPR